MQALLDEYIRGTEYFLGYSYTGCTSGEFIGL